MYRLSNNLILITAPAVMENGIARTFLAQKRQLLMVIHTTPHLTRNDLTLWADTSTIL
jgi:hypothetical protein